jgi:hypothetical protein
MGAVSVLNWRCTSCGATGVAVALSDGREFAWDAARRAGLAVEASSSAQEIRVRLSHHAKQRRPSVCQGEGLQWETRL